MNIALYKNIKNLVSFTPEIWRDYRGENCETYNNVVFSHLLKKANIENIKFKVDSFSFSKKNTLRGFHGDTKNWKLIQCLKGEIYFVVIDLNPQSPTFNNVESFNLNDKSRTQILVPPKCVNAHLCMSEECIFFYKLSHNYVGQEHQLHVKWNDPKYDIFWPIENPILSLRDSN
jgi:dTDP-4-dehydrorhamnose 3,5-epimerase